MKAVVHFEIHADDLERAKAFYSEAFGWQIQSIPGMDYNSITTTEVGEDRMPLQKGAINGGLTERHPAAKGAVIVVDVDSVEAAMKEVLAAGGEEVVSAQQVGDIGIYAMFNDTEGNLIGMWQSLAE